MKFRDFILQMLTGKNTISSKRVMGVLGWFVCLFICSASLLGIDSIMSPFNKKE